MDFVLRNQLIRTIIALCRLAARADADDVRDDLTGQCADALEIWAIAAPDARALQLRRWSEGVGALLGRLEASHVPDTSALARANVMLLRLRALMPQPGTAAPMPSAPGAVRKPKAQPKNRQQVLDAVAAEPGIRTKDIVFRLSGSLAPRTVKRALAELTAAGLLERAEHEDRTVSYRLKEQ